MRISLVKVIRCDKSCPELSKVLKSSRFVGTCGMLKRCGNDENKGGESAQRPRCRGVVEASPRKKRSRLFFLRAMLSREMPAKKRLSLGMVMSQRARGKGRLYRHTSSPGLTPTRRCRVGRQGALSPLLVVMP